MLITSDSLVLLNSILTLEITDEQMIKTISKLLFKSAMNAKDNYKETLAFFELRWMELLESLNSKVSQIPSILDAETLQLLNKE